MTRRQLFPILIGSLSFVRLAKAHEIPIPEKPKYEPPAMVCSDVPGTMDFIDYYYESGKRHLTAMNLKAVWRG